jgi:transposase
MAYSSSLSDLEWEILEPLLIELLPKKKVTCPTTWSKRDILDGIFYQLKNGCNWQDLPKDLPPCLGARSQRRKATWGRTATQLYIGTISSGERLG